ncbi:MAG: DASS family sodium-coupled anion symporter, partial [Acidobacteria bacterium]|nr:DASS family sodium-coupled anion symporter [Acidobacteriota bacterium]
MKTEKVGLDQAEAERSLRYIRLAKWAVVILSGTCIYLSPTPDGIADSSWRLLAIFMATIVGSIIQPVSGGAMALLGVAAVAIARAMPVNEALARTATDSKALEILRLKSALAGYADPVVWLVLAAFFMSHGMIRTGLGRRVALLFIRGFGRRSLGLGYALVGTDMLLATVIPSNGARCGGITFPIARSLAEEYDSRPGPTASRLGAFLMVFVYQCEVIICATFLTGQAGNLVIQRLARQQTGIDLNYTTWMLGGIVPGIVTLVVTGIIIYRLFPPGVTETPGATEFARRELAQMGSASSGEKIMLTIFAVTSLLWATAGRLHTLDYSVVALLGICLLLMFNVVNWRDLMAEHAAWDVFIWYGGMVRMAEALGETGLTQRFATFAAGLTSGWSWWIALGGLLLIYFFAHYAFASITAHALA